MSATWKPLAENWNDSHHTDLDALRPHMPARKGSGWEYRWVRVSTPTEG